MSGRATIKPPSTSLIAGTMDGRLRHSLQTPTVFHDTTHAGTRRQERQLSVEQMKDTIGRHERRIQHRRGEHGGFVYEFHQRVAGTTLVVVAEIKKHECWLITGYYEEE
jgi:hypothetical protein